MHTFTQSKTIMISPISTTITCEKLGLHLMISLHTSSTAGRKSHTSTRVLDTHGRLKSPAKASNALPTFKHPPSSKHDFTQ